MFMIVVQGKAGDAKYFEFDRPVVNIGRAEVNDIVLPVSNVSKRHARITLGDDGFILSDRHSTNGTYVNGRKLLAPLLIGETDQIHIGDFVLSVQDGPDGRRPTTPAGMVKVSQPPAIAEHSEPGVEEGPSPHGGAPQGQRMPWLDEWVLTGSYGREGAFPGPAVSGRRKTLPERSAALSVDCDVFASIPAAVPLQKSVTLRLFADAAGDFRGEAAGWIKGSASCVIEVALSFPEGGLEPIASSEGVLRVAAGERSSELSFPLWAREVGPARVEISISHRGARLATLILRVEVRDGEGVAELEPSSLTPRVLPGREDFFALGEMNSGTRIESVARDFAPDAVLRLRDSGSTGPRRRCLRVELCQAHGELLDTLAGGEVFLDAPLQERMRGLYSTPEIDQAGGLHPARREALLRGLGASLSSLLMPLPVREALEGLPAGTLLSVDCPEAWVPWELLRVGRGSRAAFLAERFPLSRGGPGSSTGRFARSPRLLVSPPCSPFVSRREQQALSALDSRLRQVHRVADVQAHLQQAGIAGWHISGRGGFDRGDRGAAVLHLSDGVLTPAQLVPAQRFQKLGHSPPLAGTFVLLHVSERREPDKPLQPAGSTLWVERFFAAGAGAVVATFFPVTDEVAGLFSEAFYRSWTNHRPLSVAVSEARESIRREGDVSWLSYCVYGLPGAMLLD